MANIVDLEYYGYPTRETYDMVLNLSNEEMTAKSLTGVGQSGELDLYDFAEYIKNYFELLEDAFPKFYQQIRNDVGSLWRVDWWAVAQHFMED